MKGLIKCTKKYQKAVLLVGEENIERIKKAIKNCSNIKFVDSLDEFKDNIAPDSYLVISISCTDYDSAAKIIKQFPDCVFHRVIEPPGSWPLKNTIEISSEPNVDKDIYLPFELIDAIKKEVQL